VKSIYMPEIFWQRIVMIASGQGNEKEVVA
jgi:hypothetical protein